MHGAVSFSFLLPPGEERAISQRLLLGENTDLSNPRAKLWNVSCNVFTEQLLRQCLSHTLWHRCSNRGGRAAWLSKPGIMKTWKSPGSGVCIFISLSLFNVAVLHSLQCHSSPVRDWTQQRKLRVLTSGPPRNFLYFYFHNTFWLQWNWWLAYNGWESDPTLVTSWLPCRNGSPSSGLCGPAFKEQYYLGPVLLPQWSFLLQKRKTWTWVVEILRLLDHLG